MSETENTWASLAATVGHDYSDGTDAVAVEAVDASGIRRLCEVAELGCPIHFDEAAAIEQGYRGLALPISAVSSTYTFQAIWNPGDKTRWSAKDTHGVFGLPLAAPNAVPMPAPHTQFAFATDIEIEYLLPVSVGDRLSRRGNRLVSVKERDTSVGSGAFIVTETCILNQRGEVVAVMRHGGYKYNPHPAAASTPPAEEAAWPAERAFPPASQPRSDWSTSLFWDDVNEGDELPPVTVQLTVQRLVIAAGANRDFNAVHHDTYLTQKTGVREMYANNALVQAFWERSVREYIGVRGWIRKLGPFRMRAFNYAGDTLTTSGVVKRKYREGGDALLELELQTVNDRTVSVGPGTVVVALPVRG